MVLRFTRFALGLALAGITPISVQSIQAESPELEQSIAAIQQAIGAGDAQKARELIANALRVHPNEAGILNLRGVLHAQAQEMTAARGDFDEAVRLSPGLLPARKNLARACQALASESQSGKDAGAMDCAMRNWRIVLAAEKGDMEARSALATLYEWQGKFAESLREMEPIPPGGAESLPVLALRCADLAGIGRFDEALQLAKRLTQSADYSDETAASIFPVLREPKTAPIVIALAEPLSNGRVASAGTLRLLGLAYGRAGRLTDARAAIEAAAVKDPGGTADLYELARLAYLAQDREGALGYLGHIRDIAPKDARADFLFGIIAVEMNLPIEARRSLERALELDPQNPTYSLAMGSVILSNRDASNAVPYFQTYLAAYPKDPRGHFALGMAYYASNDYPKARAEMIAVAKRPETSGGAEYYLGRIERADDNLDAAVAHLERAIELLPKFPDARVELAKVLLRRQEPAKAQAELKEALAIDPDNYQANTVLLALYEKTHDAKASAQRDRLKGLEGKRKDQEQLMLRTIEMRAF